MRAACITLFVNMDVSATKPDGVQGFGATLMVLVFAGTQVFGQPACCSPQIQPA